ncbi:MAG: TolC family protein [Bacteroidota bacterium]
MSMILRILFFVCLSTSVMGQQLPTASSPVFPLDSLLHWVRQQHPIWQQANLLNDQANAYLLKARGAFDPKAYGDYTQKSFDEKNYFRYGEAGVKVPTWLGVDFKLGYAWSDGIFLNPEDNLPASGQAIAGLSVPLARGMLFDQRRAQVQKARLYRNANEAERRQIINELLTDATKAYWDWAFQYQVVQVYRAALDLADNRFEMIRQSFIQGDKPAIDTLEYQIVRQDRQLQLQESLAALENSRLYLSTFLWYDDNLPLALSTAYRPQDWIDEWRVNPAQITNWLRDSLVLYHPDMMALRAKRQMLQVDERLQKENFKPQLNVNFNFLADGFDFTPDKPQNGNDLNQLLTENYKWEVQFSYPLFLRKERAGLQQVQISQLENENKTRFKRLDIRNKILGVLQQLQVMAQQLDTQADMLNNYRRLLAAENEKFRIGESSVFLLNSREQKLIESQLKQAKMQASYAKQRYKLEGVMGRMQ